jgi:hypothetical protein
LSEEVEEAAGFDSVFVSDFDEESLDEESDLEPPSSLAVAPRLRLP